MHRFELHESLTLHSCQRIAAESTSCLPSPCWNGDPRSPVAHHDILGLSVRIRLRVCDDSGADTRTPHVLGRQDEDLRNVRADRDLLPEHAELRSAQVHDVLDFRAVLIEFEAEPRMDLEKHGELVSVTRTLSNTLKNNSNTLKYSGTAKTGTAKIVTAERGLICRPVLME